MGEGDVLVPQAAADANDRSHDGDREAAAQEAYRPVGAACVDGNCAVRMPAEDTLVTFFLFVKVCELWEC